MKSTNRNVLEEIELEWAPTGSPLDALGVNIAKQPPTADDESLDFAPIIKWKGLTLDKLVEGSMLLMAITMPLGLAAQMIIGALMMAGTSRIHLEFLKGQGIDEVIDSIKTKNGMQFISNEDLDYLNTQYPEARGAVDWLLVRNHITKSPTGDGYYFTGKVLTNLRTRRRRS